MSVLLFVTLMPAVVGAKTLLPMTPPWVLTGASGTTWPCNQELLVPSKGGHGMELKRRDEGNLGMVII